MVRRLFCLLSAFAVLFFCAAPVFATGTEIGPYTGGEGGGVGFPVSLQAKVDVVDLWEMLNDNFNHNVTHVWNFVNHLLDEDVCPNAPQIGGGHNFIPRRTLKDGQVGLYYTCEYCGKAYGEALEEAYQEYVETLPSAQYNSDGAYLWKPDAADFSDRVYFRFYYANGNTAGYAFGFSASAVSGIVSDGDFSVAALIGDCFYVSALNFSVSDLSRMRFDSYPYSVRVPVAGFYTSASEASSVQSFSVPANGSISVPSHNWYFSGASSFSVPWPNFWVAPYTSGSGNTYEISTRVSGSASDGGLFGYVQDGQLYQSTVGTIYNETTNVYQNPVTGETSDVSSWNYDYSDRSYTLTTNEGDEITVTYGDSNVTINEGGTTYNVYYLMEETEDVQQALESYCDHDYSSVVTTAPTCTASGVRTYTCSKCDASYTQSIPPTGHNYQSAVTMEPTCVNTGVRTFTCFNCGDSYTVSIAATGHTWETVRTVPTTYDNDTGQLVQQGYTLYECSVCHEQYRIDADSGGSSLPAPSSGGTSTGTDLSTEIDSGVGRGFLATIAHGLTEDLPEVLKAASEWFTTFPQFYSGFMTFVKEGVAGCLPDVPRMMIGFGFGMTTFIGIVRKIIGR